MKPVQARAFFLSHGGGPLPLLGDPQHREMVLCLQQVARKIVKPSVILLVSAHWEEALPTITASASPPLLYDYYGFPAESYEIEYPAPGAPDLARQVLDTLLSAGIHAETGSSRGFDHGMFVPLKIMYPEADIPCIQVSLLNSLSAVEHLQLGKALGSLREENLLLVGSGFSFHNMQAFFAPETADTRARNQSFEQWLETTLCSREITEEERTRRLSDWQQAPAARYCHPREEHLLPLHVCYGYTQAHADEVYQMQILGKDSSMYLWHAHT